jgi:hypothetical protein
VDNPSEWWLFEDDEDEISNDSDYISFLQSFFFEPTMAHVTASQLNSLPSYDGSTNVELWIEALERARLQFDWEDIDECRAACTKMTGIAAQWLFSQKKLGKNYVDFLDFAAVPAQAGPPAVAAQPAREGLRTALIRRFAERVNSLAAVDAVSNLDQASNEDVDAFFDRCTIAVDKANYTYTDVQKQTAAYRTQFQAFMFVWFSKGLKEEIRTRIMASPAPPENMADMLAAARKVEMELKRRAEREKSGETAQVHAMQADDRRIEELSRELERLKTGNRGQMKSSTIQCHCCKGFGHIKWECPSNKPRGNRGRIGSNFRGRGGRPGYRGGFGNNRGRGGPGGRGGGRQFSPRHYATTQGSRGYGGYQRQGNTGGRRNYYVMDKNEDGLDIVYEEEVECENEIQEGN